MLFSREAARYGNTVEWWFLQGYYQTHESDRNYFMTSVFRIGTTKNRQSGHFLISSHLDGNKAGPHSYSSQVDQHIVDSLLSKKNEVENRLDRNLVDAYFEEIEQFGALNPIVLEREEALIAPESRSISWNSFALRQNDGALHLQYTDPQSADCDFMLTPQRSCFSFVGEWSPGEGRTAWQTCPRLQLSGTVGGARVSGRAWFDHQWTNDGFFFSESEPKATYGWDWLGIGLDDGRDIIIFIYREMESRKVVAQNAYLMADGHTPRHFTAFQCICRDHWQSPTTHIVYPAAMLLEIPQMQLQLTIEPLAADQEIPVWGFTRAVWEGAGRVHGLERGKPLSGIARMEFNGYGYIFSTKSFLTGFTSRIDKQIEEFLPRSLSREWLEKTIGKADYCHDPQGCTQAIAEPVWDLLDRNGKHWRPICATLFLESLGVDSIPYQQLSAAVSELNHTGSLIIDDIEDDSIIRRGEECIHLRYGIDTAINAGNTLYFLPYLLIANHPGLEASASRRMS
jgi:hypothetical protein